MKKKYLINESLYKFLQAYKLKNRRLDINENRCILNRMYDIGVINDCVDNTYNPFCEITDLTGVRLFIQLTNRCNLKCRHCYADSRNIDECDDYFNYDKSKKIINEAVENGISKIDFTGGEVFIKNFFIDLLEYIEYKPVQYDIFTNFTLIDYKLSVRIKKLHGLNRLITSLDYFDADKHNKFRGSKNAYERTMQTIEYFNDIKERIIINTIVMNDNHNDVVDILEYFRGIGIKVQLDVLSNSGRAKDIDNNINDDVVFIKDLLKYYNNIESYSWKNCINCGIGKVLLFMNYKGEYHVCPSLTSRESRCFYLGRNMRESYNNLKKIILKCNEDKCKFYEQCSYGCRARVFLNTGCINGCDYILRQLMEGDEV